MILLDFNQICLANIFTFAKEIDPSNPDPSKSIIRHAILSSILHHKKTFSSEYGELVIACDGRNYWRKDIFPYYKASRKSTRDASDIDWKFVFEVLSEIREDLRDIFPYKILHLEGCEADDIIAVICKWTQENYLDDNVLYPEPKKTSILSSDKDFKQLHCYKNVRQYAPVAKKYVETPTNIAEFIVEHIIRGDVSDGIPSVLCPDNFYIDPNKVGRAPSVTKSVVAKYSDLTNLTKEEQKRYDRNEALVAFDKIPEYISSRILEEFTKEQEVRGKGRIYKYLVKHSMRLLISEVESF